MNKILLAFFFLFWTKNSFSQNKIQLLFFERGVLNSRIFYNYLKINNNEVKFFIQKDNNKKALKLYKSSQKLKIIGYTSLATGFLVSIAALKGKKISTTIDNKEYTYTDRPLGLLAGGLGIMAGGLFLNQIGIDKTKKMVDVFNKSKSLKLSLETKIYNLYQVGIVATIH